MKHAENKSVETESGWVAAKGLGRDGELRSDG